MLYHHPSRPQPPHPVPPQGFLMQKIVACERRSIPCLRTDLCLNDCSLTCLKSVSASGMPPCWSLNDGSTLCVTLPLTVHACGACGGCRAVSASIEVETCLPHSFVCAMQDPRNQLLILPCVRLLRAECADGGCFGVQLAVSLEIFLLRYETLGCCKPQPQCPQLPLYPQPMR